MVLLVLRFKEPEHQTRAGNVKVYRLMSVLTCEEKLALLTEYQRLSQAYSIAIGDMCVRNVPAMEYRRLCTTTEEARVASGRARDRLDTHVAEHGC